MFTGPAPVMLIVMCTKRKRVLIVTTAACVLVAAALVWIYATPPAAWGQIHVGDAPAQVRAKWPTVFHDLHDIKGDFCYRSLPFGLWRLQVVYGPDHRVLKKHCILRLGTRNYFKDVHYEHTST